MKLANRTPFPAEVAVVYDRGGAEILIVALKATFRLSSGEAVPRDEQLPVFRAEEPFASGAVRFPSDIVPTKVGTDVVCHGLVHAPAGATTCDVTVRAGDLVRRTRATGRRRWLRRPDRWEISPPEPLERVAFGFESAFGGTHGEARFAPNPLGVGLWEPASDASAEGLELPALEDPDAPLRDPSDRPQPAVVGVVAADWEPRASFGGTYDQAWRDQRAPLLPDDFDDRFHSVGCGPFGGSVHLRGGEPIELTHLSSEPVLRSRVPRVPVRVRVDRHRWIAPHLDLVLIEPEHDRVAVTLRATIGVAGRIDSLPTVDLVEKKLVALGAPAP